MYIGIDYGKTRIGIAKSDPLNIISSPVQVVKNKGDLNGVFEFLNSIIDKENKFEGFVVGYPDEEDPRASKVCKLILTFVEKLKSTFNAPVFFQDERFSTRSAQEMLFEGGKNRKKRKEILDAAAASIILQNFLDQNAGSHS